MTTNIEQVWKAIAVNDQIKSDKNVVFVLDRFKTGDVVHSEMLGTEKQVFARIYLVAETIMEVNKKISEFRNLLKVIDSRMVKTF